MRLKLYQFLCTRGDYSCTMNFHTIKLSPKELGLIKYSIVNRFNRSGLLVYPQLRSNFFFSSMFDVRNNEVKITKQKNDCELYNKQEVNYELYDLLVITRDEPINHKHGNTISLKVVLKNQCLYE